MNTVISTLAALDEIRRSSRRDPHFPTLQESARWLMEAIACMMAARDARERGESKMADMFALMADKAMSMSESLQMGKWPDHDP